MSALRTVFIVGAADNRKPLYYDDVAQATDLKYELAAHQIGQLAEGRAGQPGARLLCRVSVESSRLKTVQLSRLGYAVARRFVPVAEAEEMRLSEVDCQTGLTNFLQGSTLPGLNIINDALPGVSLGTLSVLLYIATHQSDFGFEGTPAKQIAKDLGVPNLHRHLMLLMEGKEDWTARKLVAATPHKKNSRIILPELTDDGYRLISELAAAVVGETAIMPRRAKTPRLEELASPKDMKKLDDDDFDNIQWR